MPVRKSLDQLVAESEELRQELRRAAARMDLLSEGLLEEARLLREEASRTEGNGDHDGLGQGPVPRA
jgi:hypothetical protein